MPSYPWSCLACGHRNAADVDACPACGCPAQATTVEIAAHRNAYAAKGGVVLPNAAILRGSGDGASTVPEPRTGLPEIAMVVGFSLFLPVYFRLPDGVQWFDPRILLLGLFVVGAMLYGIILAAGRGIRALAGGANGDKPPTLP
jgi:hypothetical protein